jgi:predicted dehydrogenase
MTGERIGVGIIGANLHYGWGARAHIPAMQALPEFELRAVCTTREETARETAERFSIARAFDDARALVSDPAVELVLVCVKVPAHRELVELALHAGKHVFCEWPLARHLAEAWELRDLARAAGVRHMVGLQVHGAPAWLQARDLVAQGYVGRVLSASLVASSRGAEPTLGRHLVWSTDRGNGANTMTIAGGHSLEALRMCLGEFTTLSAIVSTRVPEVTIADSGEALTVSAPDHLQVVGTVESGAHVTVEVKSVPLHSSGLRFEVHGTEGMLRVTSPGMAQTGPLRLEGARRGEAVAELAPRPTDHWVPDSVTGPPEHVAQLFRRLGEEIRGDATAAPSFDDAVRLHELLESIQEASDYGPPVRLPA